VTESLFQSLRRLEEAILAAGDPGPRNWNPGLPPDVVRERFSRARLAAADDIVTWFGWHNGVGDGFRHRIGGTIAEWLTVDEAVAAHADQVSVAEAMAADLGGVDNYWPRSLVPIFAVGPSAYLGVGVLRPGDEPVPRACWPDSGILELDPVTSLHQLVDIWTSMHLDGAYQWDGVRWVKHRDRKPDALPWILF
jgi:hypothetical protein